MKNLFIVLALIFGVKFGIDYLNSPKFQVWADETKQPWTCIFENTIGELEMVMSNYADAKTRFERTVKRCPKADACEQAEFEIARCLEAMGNVREASRAYAAFAEKYKSSPRAKTADKAVQVLGVS